MKQEYYDNLPDDAKEFLSRVRIAPSDDGQLKFAFGDKQEYQVPPDDLMDVIERVIHAYTILEKFNKVKTRLNGDQPMKLVVGEDPLIQTNS